MRAFCAAKRTNAAILALSKIGIPIKQIVRQTGHSRKLVRQMIRGELNDVGVVALADELARWARRGARER